MAGAETRKSTQWYCNEAILPAAFKYLSTMGMDSSSTTVRTVVLCRECVSTLPYPAGQWF